MRLPRGVGGARINAQARRREAYAAAADLITIGRIVKPQGRHGEVAVEPLSDRSERFAELRRVFAFGAGGDPRELGVTSCWPHKGRYVLKLAGVDSIEAAEALRDLQIAIPEEELARLPEGSYYYHQLQGLEVVDEGGKSLGHVAELMETGATPNLVVRGLEGETLIPFAETFVREVNLGARRIVVNPPELVGEDGR
jgi:16S rRNA processing protein RimM